MALQERVFGLETEYAVNFYPAEGQGIPDPKFIVRTLQETLYKEYGLPDCEFLITGAKFHYDVGHAEWAGPECLTAREAAIYDKAADHILMEALPEAQELLARKGYQGTLLLAKNNVDSQGNTYGCHENYMMLHNTDLLVEDHFLRYLIRCLIPFLVSRQILTGAGRVLVSQTANTGTRQVSFELSQRASFIDTVISRETTKERPIINLAREGEPLATGNYRRLHLILGDANLSGWATWIKLGSTGILLRMIEDMFISDVALLQDPVMAIRSVARDLTCKEPLPLSSGEQMSALDIQWHYYEMANTYLEQFGFSAEEDALMRAWEQALVDIEQDVTRLRNRADWMLKKRLLDKYLQQENGSWEGAHQSDVLIDGLLARDLRYHDLGRDGLFNRMCFPDTLVSAQEIQTGRQRPPLYTRAHVRGEALIAARQHKQRVMVERWQEVKVAGKKKRLPDPLDFAPLDFEREWWEQAIANEDPRIRQRTITYLTWQNNREATSMLMHKALNDSDKRVCRAAIEALGKRADKEAKDVLIACLRDEDIQVRWVAEEALEKIRGGIPEPSPVSLLPETDDDEPLIQLTSR